MVCGPDGSEPINQYALVAYIPGPLARYLDELRSLLVPECLPNAHVTVLPPRPLQHPRDEVWEEIQSRLASFRPFDVELTEVDIFGSTTVIYLQLGEGRQRFVELHDALNVGKAAFAEPFEYHPHSTLAQWITPEQMEGVYDRARMCWAECGLPRRFRVEELTFVQNTLHNRWIDLGVHRLAGVAITR